MLEREETYNDDNLKKERKTGEKQDTLDCAKFLQSAADSGDNVLFFSTYKFFSARNERLRKNAEFSPEDGVEEFVALYKSLFNEL